MASTSKQLAQTTRSLEEECEISFADSVSENVRGGYSVIGFAGYKDKEREKSVQHRSR